MSSEEDHDENWEAYLTLRFLLLKLRVEKMVRTSLLTFKDELTKGLRTIAKGKLYVSVSINGKGSPTISCSYSRPTNASATKATNADIFIVGDLAFYGMALGKEGCLGSGATFARWQQHRWLT